MGRRKNNPNVVQELIDGRWTMPQDEFEEKYYSLSRSDMSKVAEAIHGMESELMNNTLSDEDDDVDDDDDDESLSADDGSWHKI